MRYYLLSLLFLICFAPATAQKSVKGAGLIEDGLERYTQWLQREIDENRLPMAEALIYRNGELGYHTVLGENELSSGNDLEKNQIYAMMSMTKPIVTVAFMMLYEEGHFRLKDPVAKYLPAFADVRVAQNVNEGAGVNTDSLKSPITIAQLLSHTAGFSHGLGGTALDNDIARALYYQPQADIEARVNTLTTLPLVGQPGEQWYYSASPDVLSRLIEVFSGMTTAEFLQQRIFDPLGMTDTGYNVPEEKTARVVTNHSAGEGTIKVADFQVPTRGNTVHGGTHGLFSTASDYLTFCRMLLNKGELDGRYYLSPNTVELMTMNHVKNMREPGHGFGLGFGVITDVAATEVPGSEGMYYWSGAYSTYFLIDPKEELIAILLSQRSPFSGRHGEMMQQMVYQTLGPRP